MKQVFLVLMIFVFVKLQAQTYQISFAGKGASTIVDSVQVQNLTQCNSVYFNGSDILNLNVTNGINEISNSADNTLRVYPNPMTDYCLIDFQATAQGETTIELYDIAGKRITQVQEFLTKGQHTYSLSGLSSGIYVLKVETLHATSHQYEYSAKIVSTNSTSGIPEIKQIEAAQIDNSKESINLTSKNLKSNINKSLINMQYTPGDILKLTGFSGIYSTVNILVPTKNQTDTFNFIACTDNDNNHYAVVQIGTQIWMEENLKTTTYNDGTAIPNVTVDSLWGNLITPAYCWYGDSINPYKNIYGALYNWYTVNTSKLCLAGWHVPTYTEWDTLVNYLGGRMIAGGKMKDVCLKHWFSPNTDATNSTGLTFLPGGICNYGVGSFVNLGSFGSWWSATESDASNAWNCYLLYTHPNADLSNSHKQGGLSVRCVKDY